MLTLISVITDIAVVIYVVLTITAFYIGMPLHALFFLAFAILLLLLKSFNKHPDDDGADDEEG